MRTMCHPRVRHPCHRVVEAGKFVAVELSGFARPLLAAVTASTSYQMMSGLF